MERTQATPLPPVGGSIPDVVRVTDPAFARLIDPAAPLVRLVDGCIWAEGPVWIPGEQALLFSDIPNDRAIRWTVARGGEVARQPNDFTNGNTLDREGRVVHCEHGPRRVTRDDGRGGREVLADLHGDGRLNSPNDVVVRSDGTIWFTDPPYGILSNREGYESPSEQEGCFVFRLDPADGSLEPVVTTMGHPNGLAFSPDESILYVADTLAAVVEPTAPRRILAFDVLDGRRLGPGRVFTTIDPGVPDGFRVDRDGNVWTSAYDGIQVYAPDGHELGRILVPEVTANCVWGGDGGTRLFITASSSLYAIETRTIGAGVAAAVARGEVVR